MSSEGAGTTLRTLDFMSRELRNVTEKMRPSKDRNAFFSHGTLFGKKIPWHTINQNEYEMALFGLIMTI